MPGFGAGNKTIVDERFICSICLLILRDPVQIKTCGHRFCQSCIVIGNKTTIKCSQCQSETTPNEILIDRGFKNDMQSLSITCTYCDWTDTLRNYQEHINQYHSNPKCNYCNQQFNSIDLLYQHQISQCEKMFVECLLKEYGCHEQIPCFQLSNHYQSKQHQDSILNIIHKIHSQSTNHYLESNQMDTDSSQQTTTINENIPMESLQELHETIDLLGNGAKHLSHDRETLNNELIQHQNRLRNLTDECSNVKLSVEDQVASLDGFTRNLEILNQALVSLKEKIDDMDYVSNDGTYTWKITKFTEKMNDARSERQTSIYSPSFYSSPTGYKMCARLYLNGDGNARHTHMSLFFVLMRGRNDPILKFPFKFKVTFCMYDQTGAREHIIDSFRPDIRSSSFERPRSEMNIASGIPRFVPLSKIQQENNPYVRDDTMFIKIMVDFGEMSKSSLRYALSLNPGLPMFVQQEMIQQEKDRRDMHNSSDTLME